jgi:hypothetical protein
MVGPLATGATVAREQRGDLGPGLIGELVAADRATSHIARAGSRPTYNTSRQTGPRRLGRTLRWQVGGSLDQLIQGRGDGLITAGHHVLERSATVGKVWPMRSISSRVFAPAARASVAAECRRSWNAVPPPHPSSPHGRHPPAGWGSTYAAPAHGRVDVEALRDLLARHPLHDGEPIHAVHVSTWPRCDAETSPGRSHWPSSRRRPRRRRGGKALAGGTRRDG